jgi:Glycosyltransferase like family 2
MKLSQIEIPADSEKTLSYRVFEILPGLLSWLILILPFVLSFFNVRLVAIIMISYLLLWFFKAVALNIRVLQSWRTLEEHKKLDWQKLIDCIDPTKASLEKISLPKWHFNNLDRMSASPNGIKPREVYQAVIIATYNEPREILEPTIESVLASDFDPRKLILIIAYEKRGGKKVAEQSLELVKKYGPKVFYAEAVEHPDNLRGEVVGKGGNITYAGRRLADVVKSKKIDPDHVIVTTLDADNRPHPKYFACLTYVYSLCHQPRYMSFQPIPMFTNNIWDAPAPMRVIATGNSYWMMVQAYRQHMLRNFAAHSQGLGALIDTDFWSTRTVVEDGHQFWRSYFRFDGQHEVIPIFLPNYQDAVLASGYLKTMKAQFIQLRRWAYGASDIAYVAKMGFFTKNKISKTDVTFKFFRLLEGHVSWATSPLILAFGSLIPFLFHNRDYLANQLPQLASRIQTLAMFGILITLFLSFKILPPKPSRYRHSRSLFMILQWALLPVTTICFSSLAAINSQTRLMFKRYLGHFDVTEKAVKTDTGVVNTLS